MMKQLIIRVSALGSDLDVIISSDDTLTVKQETRYPVTRPD